MGENSKFLEFPAPIKGILKGISPDKGLTSYSEYMSNVRPTDVLDSRFRLGQRPGLDKWGNGDQIGGIDQPVVALTYVTTVA